MLGKVGDGKERFCPDVLLGNAQACTAVVDTATFGPFAIARRKVTETGLTWNNVRRLSRGVTSSGLSNIKRNIEVCLLHRTSEDDLAAKALTVEFENARRNDKFASSSS